MSDIQIGINPANVRTAAEGSEFKVGTIASVSDPISGTVRDYIYVTSTAGITDAGYVAYIDPLTFTATMTTTANVATAPKIGYPLGVAQAVVPALGFGWVQTYGPVNIRTGAAVAAGAAVSSFTSAGTVNTGITTAAAKFSGIAITTTAAGAQLTTAFLSYPVVANINL